MDRPSKDEVLMRCALAFAERSTCVRVKAGAVIAVDNHIVSTGYNGNAPGQEHCSEHFRKLWEEKYAQNYLPEQIENAYNWWITDEEFKALHREWATEHELHAEMNAIIWAARRGINIEGAVIYTTYSPCIFCTKAIIHAGFKKVFYHNLYDRPEGLKSIAILKENNIEVEELKIEEM